MPRGLREDSGSSGTAPSWKVGFAYTERKICCARGWRRRFYQGSTDHRGTTAFPGRTVTLARPCWGAAYRVAPEDVEATLANLEVREKQYDLRAQFDLHARPRTRTRPWSCATP